MSIKDLDKVAEFFTQLRKQVFSRKGMQELGDLAKDVVFKRTKSGFGVDRDNAISPRKVRLNSLSASYINQRRKKGVRGSFGAPARSNLTNTGQLLDSMVVTAKIGSVSIEIPNTARRGDGKLNKEIARFVATNGRPFFALTRDEQTLVRTEIETKVRVIFNKVF